MWEEIASVTKMRVCLDAHMLGEQETGNETYVAGLAPALACLPDVECLAAIKPGAKVPQDWGSNPLSVAALRPSGDWLRLMYALPRLCRTWRADILHVTYNGPFFSPCPVVVTVHDVIFKRYPAFFSARDRLLFATLLRLTLRRAAAIITDSESSRRDIVTFYPFTRDKIHVVPLAVNPAFRVEIPADQSQAARARYHIDSPFILAVGNLQPRKNLQRLTAAFRRLLADGFSSHRLVLVGNDAFRSSEFRAEAQDLLQSGQLALTGYVPEEDLPVLYREADIFVYPSLSEGFGLPILEAMACGTPVVTSNTSSMPEVAGQAALLVDPLDVDQIKQAIHTILTRTDLASALVERGSEWIKHFTWHETARRVAAVYQAVLSQRHASFRNDRPS
jgi:glycosyltransferase involved in cell wall biosynthesis